MEWESTWNRSAVVVIASDSRAIVEIELCLFDVLVYAQISYVRVQAPHFACPAPPRPESTTRATEPEARSRTKSEQYVRAEQADADAQTFSLPVKLVAARAGAHSTNTGDARSHT